MEQKIGDAISERDTKAAPPDSEEEKPAAEPREPRGILSSAVRSVKQLFGQGT